MQPVDVPFVFERSAAASLGILMPSVAAGQVQIPSITIERRPPSVLAKDAGAPSTAAAVTLDSRTPKRVAGSFELRVEDLAVWPQLEDALSEAMQGKVSDELDEQTIQRHGNRAERAVPYAGGERQQRRPHVETYKTGIARFAALVDGKHAYSAPGRASVHRVGNLRALRGRSSPTRTRAICPCSITSK